VADASVINNKQVSKLLLHIVYPTLPASGDTGQGYAEVGVAQASRVHLNKLMPVSHNISLPCSSTAFMTILLLVYRSYADFIIVIIAA
jgi:hypothetical protein